MLLAAVFVVVTIFDIHTFMLHCFSLLLKKSKLYGKHIGSQNVDPIFSCKHKTTDIKHLQTHKN